MIAGGGAAETEVSLRLKEMAQGMTGMDAYCTKEYANALEVVPYTLAENAGLNPINFVTELRKAHAEGMHGAGINVKKNKVTDMYVGERAKTRSEATSFVATSLRSVGSSFG